MGKENQISSFQLMSIVTGTSLGVAILTLPEAAARTAGPSGWLTVLLGGILALLPLAVFAALGRRFPAANLIQYSDNILGVFFGKLVAGVFVLYWLCVTSLAVRLFGAVVITTLLPRTPLELTITLMLLLTAYLVQFDVHVFARMQEIFFPIYFLVLLPLPFALLGRVQYLHLLPLGPGSPAALVQGIAAGAGAYLGFEVVSMYLPHAAEPQGAFRPLALGMALVTLINTGVTILAIGVFSAPSLTRMLWPTLELIKVARLPGLIFERADAAFVSLWLIAVFTTVASLFYSTARALASLTRLGSQAKLALPLVPILYYLALLPPNVPALLQYTAWTARVGGVIVLTLPLLLLGVAVLRRKRGKANVHV